MGKSSTPAPAADPHIGEAAIAQTNLGIEQLNFAKEQFGIGNVRQAGQDTIANQVTQSQLDAQKQASGWAAEDRARSKSVFQPMQDTFINKANTWDSATRQDQVASEAGAGVMANATMAQGQMQRNEAAQGIEPGSGRYDGNDRAQSEATALGAAGAENAARNTVRSQGMALQGDAVNMGNGLAGQAAQSLSLGVNAGSSAFGTANANNAAARANIGTMNSGYAGAQSGYASGVNSYHTADGENQNAWQMQEKANNDESSGIMKGVGAIAGMALAPATGGASLLMGSMLSSKTLKENKRPTGDNLKAVKSMPVQDWNYKDGVADGGKHTGPYAEDFQKATGKGDGKSILFQDAVGVTMGAVQQLDDKVDKLAGAVARIAPKSRGITRASIQTPEMG